MAKKSRRNRRAFSAKQTTTPPAPPAASSAAVVEAKSAAPRVVAAQKAQADSSKRTPDFSTEYHYVISDLRRMGILAGVLFVALVVLALVV